MSYTVASTENLAHWMKAGRTSPFLLDAFWIFLVLCKTYPFGDAGGGFLFLGHVLLPDGLDFWSDYRIEQEMPDNLHTSHTS